MQTITVRVRPDGKTYEDVVIGEMDWEAEELAVEQSRKERINQQTMQKEEYFDSSILRLARVCGSIKESKTQFSPAVLKKMPRVDVMIMLNAFAKCNEPANDDATKSGPQENDSGRGGHGAPEPEGENRASGDKK